jgi:NAD(P)H-nitrite reductase large subunit
MRHVIIGTGPAGVIAAETLRETDPESSVTLIGDEPGQPYSRMALPYYLAGDIGEEGMHLRKGRDHFQKLGIQRLEARVAQVSSTDNSLTLENGDTIAYDRLLIATGSRPSHPDIPGLDLPGVFPCWTSEDGRNIAARAKPGAPVVLWGAGFIACIIIKALVARGVKVSIIMRSRMVRSMMSPTASEMIRRWCVEHGVEVYSGANITEIAASDETPDRLAVSLDNGETLDAASVIVATGVASNVEFLDGVGVDTDQGILVDEHMCTSIPNIYAAGDVAQGCDFSTGERLVHAIQPSAVDQGRVAALNMIGQESKYHGSLSMNVLDTMGLISSSFGLWQGVDGGEMAEIVDEENYKYISLAFKDDLLIGANCVGRTEDIGVLRGLIQSKISLGPWKERLMKDPNQMTEAYIARTLASYLPVS